MVACTHAQTKYPPECLSFVIRYTRAGKAHTACVFVSSLWHYSALGRRHCPEHTRHWVELAQLAFRIHSNYQFIIFDIYLGHCNSAISNFCPSLRAALSTFRRTSTATACHLFPFSRYNVLRCIFSLRLILFRSQFLPSCRPISRPRALCPALIQRPCICLYPVEFMNFQLTMLYRPNEWTTNINSMAKLFISLCFTISSPAAPFAPIFAVPCHDYRTTRTPPNCFITFLYPHIFALCIICDDYVRSKSLLHIWERGCSPPPYRKRRIHTSFHIIPRQILENPLQIEKIWKCTHARTQTRALSS